MMRCAETIREYLPTWKVVVTTQEYSSVEDQAIRHALPGAIVVSLSKRVGMHNAKLAALRQVHSLSGTRPYVVCSIDDDMEFLPQTNLDPCVEKCQDPSVGFVTAGWVAHPNHLAKRVVRHAFVKQAIVYTAGGMVFDRKTADLIRQIPEGRYFSDNTQWSLTAYTAGLANYRYLGSMTIHRICQKGGRRSWISSSDVILPDPDLISVREGRPIAGKVEYLIGRSDDLTDQAHHLHKTNAARRRERTP